MELPKYVVERDTGKIIYLKEKDVVEITKEALSTLRNNRCLRRGIPYYVIGGKSIRYKLSDVLAYMEARKITFEEE